VAAVGSLVLTGRGHESRSYVVDFITKLVCTDFVPNVTITLDEETARWARVEAAKSDVSTSRFIGEVLRRHMTDAAEYERARRSYSRRAVGALTSGHVRYPSRDDLHRR
jgi:hypothetical protein